MERFVRLCLARSLAHSIAPFAPAAGGGRRLRVLCAAPSRDALLGTQLLWGVRQRWGHDERGRYAHVLFPGESSGFGAWGGTAFGWG